MFKFITYLCVLVLSGLLLQPSQSARAADSHSVHEQEPLTLAMGMYEGIETSTREYILLGIQEHGTHFILDYRISNGFYLHRASYFTDDNISCTSINCTITFFDEMGNERRLTMVPSNLGYWNITDSHLRRGLELLWVENYNLKHIEGDSAAYRLVSKHGEKIQSLLEGNEHDFYLGYSYGPRAHHHELLTLELHDDNTATFEVYTLGSDPSLGSKHTLTVSRGELDENHLVLRSEENTRLRLSLFNNNNVLLEGFFLVGEPQIPGKSADKAVYFMKVTPIN